MKTIITFILFLSLGSVFGQMSSGDLAVKLYELANVDSTITETESKLIKDILAQYDESETSYTIGYTRPKRKLRKDLNPMTYIKDGIIGGHKNNMYRLQSRIIQDITEAGRQVLERR